MNLTLNFWAALVLIAALIAFVKIVRIVAQRPRQRTVHVHDRPTNVASAVDDLAHALLRDLARAGQPRTPPRGRSGVSSSWTRGYPSGRIPPSRVTPPPRGVETVPGVPPPIPAPPWPPGQPPTDFDG